ncbi:MAG: hypothetical protein ACP5NW_03145 [Candidatus Woesearchaeota archaeon]
MLNMIDANKRTKGQAALEFLVTYGWAILGAIIVIGALSYFGIFNTQRYVNDVCYFGDQMTCEDYVAYNNATVGVRLRNNFGVPINVSAFEIKSDYGVVSCNLGGLGLDNIQPGVEFAVGCAINSYNISVNNKLKYKATVTFSRTNSAVKHNQTGDVTVTVQKP